MFILILNRKRGLIYVKSTYCQRTILVAQLILIAKEKERFEAMCMDYEDKICTSKNARRC